MHEDIETNLDLDFQEIPDGIDGLRKAFYKQNGFDELSRRVTGKFSLSLTFKNADLKNRYRKALMDSDNPHLEGFSMYGFGDNSELAASVEYTGTMHDAFGVFSSLDRIKDLDDGYIINREPFKQEKVTFDPQKSYEDEQVVRCFYEWVRMKMCIN